MMESFIMCKKDQDYSSPSQLSLPKSPGSPDKIMTPSGVPIVSSVGVHQSMKKFLANSLGTHDRDYPRESLFCLGSLGISKVRVD